MTLQQQERLQFLAAMQSWAGLYQRGGSCDVMQEVIDFWRLKIV
jgi:hypothetical protein